MAVAGVMLIAFDLDLLHYVIIIVIVIVIVTVIVIVIVIAISSCAGRNGSGACYANCF